MTAVPRTDATARGASDDLLRDYHDARRREEQWRIPQLLLALLTPILILGTLLFMMAGRTGDATAVGALALSMGVAAARIATQVWRWHRIAISRINDFRTSSSADASLLMRDPF